MRRSALAAANGDSGWCSGALRARGDDCVTCAEGIPGCWLPLESAPQPAGTASTASTANTARTKPRDSTVRKALRSTKIGLDSFRQGAKHSYSTGNLPAVDRGVESGEWVETTTKVDQR